MKIHNQVSSDPEKAASALLKLEKENPPGMGHRKSVIDWGQWNKAWGVRDSVKDERPEEEMDVRDFLFYQKKTEVMMRQQRGNCGKTSSKTHDRRCMVKARR